MAGARFVIASLANGKRVRIPVPDGQDYVLVRGPDGQVRKIHATEAVASTEPVKQKKSALTRRTPPRGEQPNYPSHQSDRIAGDLTKPVADRPANPKPAPSGSTRSHKPQAQAQTQKIQGSGTEAGNKKLPWTKPAAPRGEGTPAPSHTSEKLAPDLTKPIPRQQQGDVSAVRQKQSATSSISSQGKNGKRHGDQSRSGGKNGGTARQDEARGHARKRAEHASLTNFTFPSRHPSAAQDTKLDYTWPRRGIEPFAHQVATTNFIVSHRRSFCLNDMGTGKTMSVLWAFDYLRSKNEVTRALIVCPLSTIRQTWEEAIKTHFPHLRRFVLHGDPQERRRLLRETADIYLINHDGLKIPKIVELLGRRDDIDFIVVDEIAQVARNVGSKRFKALDTIINRQQSPRYACGLTGTPIPNRPTDAWAQARLIVPERFHDSFSRFQDEVMEHVGYGYWRPRANAIRVVANAMYPSIRYARDECIDLPPVVSVRREVELTKEQGALYDQMLRELVAEAKGGKIAAFNEAAKAQKLLQIACGAAYTIAGDTAFIPAGNRLELVKEVIDEAGGKVIVFTPFRGVLQAVVRYLAERLAVEEIHGGVPTKRRDEIFSRFQGDQSLRVLVAQPSAMSHGLNLTAANTIIWFGPIYDNDVYQQANARISRPGQKRKQLIVNLHGSEIERRIYDRLQRKQAMQGLLLELLRDRGG